MPNGARNAECGMRLMNERGCELVGYSKMVRYSEDEGLCEEDGDMWNYKVGVNRIGYARCDKWRNLVKIYSFSISILFNLWYY